MNAGRLLIAAGSLAIGMSLFMAGCRTEQTAQVVKPGEKQMVGSHEAGGETFGPLVETAVNNIDQYKPVTDADVEKSIEAMRRVAAATP